MLAGKTWSRLRLLTITAKWDVIPFCGCIAELHTKGNRMECSVPLLFGFALCAASGFGQTDSDIASHIVGTWKLVSTEETMKNGTTRPFPSFGPHAKGFLIYQRDGYMCALLMNPDRPRFADSARPTLQEKAAAADGTFAYCGKYEIDAEHSQIVHLPELATDPGLVGSRQIRPYRLEDGRLIFSDLEKNDPSVERWKIVWQKVTEPSQQ